MKINSINLNMLKGTTMDKSVLSVKDLSKEMSISLPTAYALAKSTGFPHIQIGRRLLIPRNEFNKWLSKNCK